MLKPFILFVTLLLPACAVSVTWTPSPLNTAVTSTPAVPVPPAIPQVLAGPILNPSNGHTYYLLAPASWTSSEAAAQKLGGHLATVRNLQEQAWILATFGPETDFSPHSLWIGLYQDPDQNYLWASGEPAPYRNWEPTEPNSSGGADGQYTFIGRYADGTWNDTNNLNQGAPTQYFGPLPRGLVELTPAN